MQQFLKNPPELKDKNAAEEKWKMLVVLAERISLWEKGNKQDFDFKKYLKD